MTPAPVAIAAGWPACAVAPGTLQTHAVEYSPMESYQHVFNAPTKLGTPLLSAPTGYENANW